MRVTTYFYTTQGTPEDRAYFFDYRIDAQQMPPGAVQVAVAHDQSLVVDYESIPWLGCTTGRKAIAYWCGGTVEVSVPETLLSLTGLFWSVIKDPWWVELG